MSSYIQNGNSITVPKGSTIEYTVSLKGYVTQTHTIIADETKVIQVTLESNMVTLTINPTPSDAVVTLTANGYTQNGNSITVERGTSVKYIIEKEGYGTTTNTIVVGDTSTMDILLIPYHTLTINPTPSDAVVTLTANGYTQNGNSITVLSGTNVSINITKNNYQTHNSSVIVTKDELLNIDLIERDEKIFKIITPQENAIIEFEVVNTDGIYSYNGEETMNYSSN